MAAPDDLQEQADKIGRDTSERLRSATYRMLLGLPSDDQRESDWALLITGSAITLLVSNMKNLLEVYHVMDMKFGLGALLLSASCGISAKRHFKQIQKAGDGEEGRVGVEWAQAAKLHMERMKPINEAAKAQNLEVRDSLTFGPAFDPLDPRLLKKVHSELEARESDPHRKWQDALSKARIHPMLVGMQFWLLVGAFIVFVITLKAPGKLP